MGYQNPDSLAEHIRCLYPISYELEKTYANNAINSGDLKLMQQYFLSFWLNRDAVNPQTAWETYFLEVRKVVKEFSTSIRKGYNTDRGRVYLQYGPPDNRTQMPHEPSAYPYEIWQYYKVKGQSNRRFVFYNPDLVTNDYALIHSDALGEIMNDQWQMLVFKRDTQNNDIDQSTPAGRFGTQIQQNYQTPR
jgi:GWxTD domain-containing protein